MWSVSAENNAPASLSCLLNRMKVQKMSPRFLRML